MCFGKKNTGNTAGPPVPVTRLNPVDPKEAQVDLLRDPTAAFAAISGVHTSPLGDMIAVNRGKVQANGPGTANPAKGKKSTTQPFPNPVSPPPPPAISVSPFIKPSTQAVPLGGGYAGMGVRARTVNQ